MLSAISRHVYVFCAVITIVIAGGCVSGPPKEAPRHAGKEAVSDEQQIRAVLDRLRDDIDHRRLQRVLAAVSDNYKDETGRDFAAVHALLAEYFRDYRSIRITRTPPKLSIAHDEARSIETLGISGEPGGGNVPALSFQGNVSVHLRRVEHTWQVTKVQLLR